MEPLIERTLVIVPAFNEEASIEYVVRSIQTSVPGIPVLVVDDGSADGTAAVARSSGARVLQLPVHLGLGGCVQTGYKLAFDLGYDYVIRVDGDGQHDANDIARILETLRTTGCEVVLGSRYINGDGHAYTSLTRALGVRFFRAILRPILGQRVHDPSSGLVGVNRLALQVFSRTFPLEYPEIEMLVVLERRAFRFREIPCRMRARIAGKSSITPWRSIYYIAHVLLGVFVNVLKSDLRPQRQTRRQ